MGFLDKARIMLTKAVDDHGDKIDVVASKARDALDKQNRTRDNDQGLP